MCDPITIALVTSATVAAVGTGVTVQQSTQARKSSETQSRGQIAEAQATSRRAETTRQQGILQQQKDQGQIAKKLSSKRENMLARYNIAQGGKSQTGNILGVNQLAGTNTQVLG